MQWSTGLRKMPYLKPWYVGTHAEKIEIITVPAAKGATFEVARARPTISKGPRLIPNWIQDILAKWVD